MLTPLELIQRLAALIPPPHTHRHRYHGVLAPNATLRAAVTALAPAASINAQLQRRQETKDTEDALEVLWLSPARYLWAMLLARIYESAPLACPQCGADMRNIAFVTDGVLVRRILTHIGEPTDPPRIAPGAPLRYAILLRLRTSPSLPWLGRSLLKHSLPLLCLGTGLGLLPKSFFAAQFTRRKSRTLIFSGCLRIARTLTGYRNMRG